VFVLMVLGGLALVVAIAFGLAATGGALGDEPTDTDVPHLPERPLTAADVPRLRFRRALLGYRQDDVDAALLALAHSLPPAASAAADDGAATTVAEPGSGHAIGEATGDAGGDAAGDAAGAW
jgi:DivIVA domain-containing protein